MRSQLAVEEITARASQSLEYKDVWLKRDLNLEEWQKEKDPRQEAEEKILKRTETEKKFYWKMLDMRLRRWFIRQREEEVEKPQQQQQEVHVMKRAIN